MSDENEFERLLRDIRNVVSGLYGDDAALSLGSAIDGWHAEINRTDINADPRPIAFSINTTKLEALRDLRNELREELMRGRDKLNAIIAMLGSEGK